MRVDSSFSDPKSVWNDASDNTPDLSELRESIKLLDKIKSGSISPRGCHSRILLARRDGKVFIGRRMPSDKAAITNGSYATLQPASANKPEMYYAWTEFVVS